MRLWAFALIVGSSLVAQDLARLRPAAPLRGEVRDLADTARGLAWEARTFLADLLFLEADLLWHTQDPEGMEAKLAAASRVNPAFVDAWLLASWHFAYNRAEEEPERRDEHIAHALALLERALAANPGHPELLFQKAWILYEREKAYRAAGEVLNSIAPEQRTALSSRLAARVRERLATA